MINAMKAFALFCMLAFLAACGGVPEPELDEVYEYETTEYAHTLYEHEDYYTDEDAELVDGGLDAVEYFVSVIVMRIHEDMPEFTFRRIIGGLVPEEPWTDIPNPREVSIIIEDEDGNIIQEIFGLSQTDWQTPKLMNITFDDLNFDGYLDMRLLRYQHGVGGLLVDEYFWLWDTDLSQFVLNEQLMAVEQSALFTNFETRQIEAWARVPRGGYFGVYEWHYDELVQVATQTEEFVWHGEHGPWYFQIVKTNMLTGEITTTIMPADRYGNLID